MRAVENTQIKRIKAGVEAELEDRVIVEIPYGRMFVS